MDIKSSQDDAEKALQEAVFDRETLAHIVDAKDFKIKNLERILAQRTNDVARMEKRLDSAQYFVKVVFSMMTSDLKKKEKMILAALAGEIEKPILTLSEDDHNI